MTTSYTVNTRVRLINRLISTLIRLNLGPKRMVLLTVKGRKSGRPYTIPVSLMSQNGSRYLVAPYGEVGWVQNARAAGCVTIQRGRHKETLAVQAVDAHTAAPILKQYIGIEAITRPYFEAAVNDPVEAFEKEAHRHPVFRLVSDR